MGKYGANLNQLKELLELTDAEADRLAAGYSDQSLAGPAVFVADMCKGIESPELALRYGKKNADKMKREIKKLLREVRVVLVDGGPDALGRFLDKHPFGRVK